MKLVMPPVNRAAERAQGEVVHILELQCEVQRQGPAAATIDLHQCRVGGLRYPGPSRSRLQGFALFGKGASMFKPQILCAALIVATVTGCDKPAPPTL